MCYLVRKISKVLVDGRVFSTSAHDRGMGRYVRHIVALFQAAGHRVTLLLFRNCYLERDDSMLREAEVRFANHDPEAVIATQEVMTELIHKFTAYLSDVIETDGIELYVDSTPFLLPCRANLVTCPVLAVFYDLIPLKHPEYYLSNEVTRRFYNNGLVRVAKADAVVCISETVAEEAVRYLGLSRSRMSVIYPTLEDRYLDAPPNLDEHERYLFAILGSHKSKNPEGSIRIYRQILGLERFWDPGECSKG